MKIKLTLALMVVMVIGAKAGGFGTDCPTLEQQQAAFNQKLAAGVKVVNAATQQTQTYYAQLATYYQQLDTTNQQNAKTAQQIAKDAQQIAFDKALLAREAAVKAKEAALLAATAVDPNPWKSDGKGGWIKVQCGETWTSGVNGTFVDGLPLEEALKAKGEAAYLAEQDYIQAKEDYKKAHTNRSGGSDGTNPGGHGNQNGYLNPNNKSK